MSVANARMTRTRAPRSAMKETSKFHKAALGRSLASLLRHNAAVHGLRLREDGYANVQDVLALPMFRGHTLASIQAEVENNDKKRFKMVQETDAESGHDTWFIRANQGHSIETVVVDMEELVEASKIPLAVHATHRKAWNSISQQGLSKMSRQHIHLLPDINESRLRFHDSILIFIDAAKAMNAGIRFFRTENNVILTPGDANGLLVPEFFARVEERRTGKAITSWAPTVTRDVQQEGME